MAKSQPDWEAIESAYRAGSLSIRAVADKYGVKESTLRSRAKANGWKRDLSTKVKQSTKEKVSRTGSRTGDKCANPTRTDEEIIDEASDEAASVIFAHRFELAQWRRLSRKLSDALSEMVVNDSNHDKFARSLNAGVDAEAKVIKLERQAYNIDDDPQRNDTESLSDLMDELSSEA
ncbi:hypothetical protein LMG33818_000898 [Halomonadaceae bacterium LMG 33818]|uniref:hypothetical protein n=1 Tax=Cernens ardua TaxID=3402176 RepID=UPI003EDC6193